ncbi:dirigent protein 23-like [Tripterygium wilfordii]|uniref:dirigent protein 23-like n=1 Tax=Tripterygium wilfordii TaxID=458696 RepID=UPI0018F83943|nr:dirigent protein 23-like [Tripterygium wilfordii]XP_038725986.1 dirigent protein 23-like [Tripterygium wilfordii]
MASTNKMVSLFALLVLCFAASATTTKAQGPIRTDIEFYLHEIINGTDPTAVPVAARSNYTGTNPFAAIFGTIYVIDNPLRSSGDPNSTLVGRAQGLYIFASLSEPALFISATYTFVSGDYNGSSFSVVGLNKVRDPVREIPVVGGTGKFRFASGYSFLRTFSVDSLNNNIIGYNVTLRHY